MENNPESVFQKTDQLCVDIPLWGAEAQLNTDGMDASFCRTQGGSKRRSNLGAEKPNKCRFSQEIRIRIRSSVDSDIQALHIMS